MHPISIVIVCKNESETIAGCVNSVKQISSDILVYDNGSTDGTVEIARSAGARVIEGEWHGYGETKKLAVTLAAHDWVLCLDADEQVDEQLVDFLKTLETPSLKTAFRFRFKNFFGKKWLRYGEWGWDKHIRMFNRKTSNWDEAPVHEDIMLPPDGTIITAPGFILHYTLRSLPQYTQKIIRYALLNGEKYHREGKRASWVKLYLAPTFAFIKYYLLKLGFLDGWQGMVCAGMTSFYTFIKYSRLRELQKNLKKRHHS